MKKRMFVVIWSIVTVLAPTRGNAQDFKTGVVDMKKVFAEYYADQKPRIASEMMRAIEQTHKETEVSDPCVPVRQIENLIRTTPGCYETIPEVRRLLRGRTGSRT